MSLFRRRPIGMQTPIDKPHVISEAAAPKRSALFEKFLSEYDPEGKLEFNDVQFRKGAVITESFGLQNGYKMIDNKMEWGYVRLHAGIDRARGGTEVFDWGTVEDIVRVPFNANRSAIYEYGDVSYGTLIILFNDEYDFEFRIAHMNPDTERREHNEKGPLIPWSYGRLKKGQHFERNWVLGSAGSWGASTGAHTHTEIKSAGPKNEIFELILEEKYGTEGTRDYSSDEVIEAYRRQNKYRTSTSERILRDYAQLREDKKVIILNPHKCQYTDWDGKIRTRYSTESLFNGL